LLLSVVIAFVVSAASGEDGGLGLVTGNEYRGWPLLGQLAFLQGFGNGLVMGEALTTNQPGSSRTRHRIIECFSPMTTGQIHAIVEKFLNANPERWLESMPELIMRAAFSACR
jgi:hypothetical protein